MLTCFIRYEITNPGQYFSMSSLLIVPIFYLIYYIYAFVKIFQKYRVQQNKEFKHLIIKYLIYSLTYIIFYFPIILLYLITMNKDITETPVLRWFAYYCTIFLIIINPILCILKILEGYVKCQLKAILPNVISN
jgi:hypothetical protein